MSAGGGGVVGEGGEYCRDSVMGCFLDFLSQAASTFAMFLVVRTRFATTGV